MRRLLLLALAASALQAASIRGVVLENMTGRPLQRTRVTLARISHRTMAKSRLSWHN